MILYIKFNNIKLYSIFLHSWFLYVHLEFRLDGLGKDTEKYTSYGRCNREGVKGSKKKCYQQVQCPQCCIKLPILEKEQTVAGEDHSNDRK